MISERWETSKREFGVLVEDGQYITMDDGIDLACQIFRPDAPGNFPAILGIHGYTMSMQTDPIKPNSFSSVAQLHPGEEKPRGSIEAGDPWFYARRGYVHVILNVRGTGMSGGVYGWMDDREAEDIRQAIEWIASQAWCSGNVGMFGVSYFAMAQFHVAGLRPEALKCLFAPYGSTPVREIVYHGGILNAGWLVNWTNDLENPTIESESLKEFGEAEFWDRVESLKYNDEIQSVARLREALAEPVSGRNALIVDILMHPTAGPYWEKRTPKYENINVPVYMGADWGTFGIHLRTLSNVWRDIDGLKRMVIGSPTYLDRPLSQMQYESLRWFDRWLKGVDTEVESDPAVRLFLMGKNRWISADEWPMPDTRWIPFYFHENGLLSERDHWWEEGHDAFFDSPWHRGSVEYWTPPLVDEVNVIGPLQVDLFAATWHKSPRWIVTILKRDAMGEENILTKGMLDGDFKIAKNSRGVPFDLQHDFAQRVPESARVVNSWKVPVIPTGMSFEAGSRLGVRIACSDTPPRHPLEAIAAGHLRGQQGQRVIVQHNATYPSCVWVPIESGNVLGTFLSGGIPYLNTHVCA